MSKTKQRDIDEADGLLRSGETVEEALAALHGIPVDAVLFNCCDADAITAARPHLRAATKLPIGGYANAFVPIDKNWTRDGSRLRDLRGLTPEDYTDLALRWCAAGAETVGGCCGVGAAHIANLREELDRVR